MDTRMKFAADAMLGKLAKWLRILGCDTTYESGMEDDVLVAHARAEGRLILTRDTRLVGRLAPGEYLFIKDNAPYDQLRQAAAELGLGICEGRLLTRCTWCNDPVEEVEKEVVRGHVPEFTFARTRRFYRCPSCGRIYWTGTHRERIIKRLAGAGIKRVK